MRKLRKAYILSKLIANIRIKYFNKEKQRDLAKEYKVSSIQINFIILNKSRIDDNYIYIKKSQFKNNEQLINNLKKYLNEQISFN